MKMLTGRFWSIFLLVIACFWLPFEASADLTMKQHQELSKQRDKVYKEKVKELTKDGWKIASGFKTLELALLEHLDALSQEGITEWSGITTRCRSISAGRQAAIVNAQTTYANEISGQIDGIVASIVSLDESNPESEMSLFSSEFKKKVKVNLSGIMKESYALVRDNGAYKEYMIVFTINERAAAQAQKRAIEASAENASVSQDIIKKICESIDSNISE